MCYDGGVGHSGEKKMADEFNGKTGKESDYKRIRQKHPSVTVRDVYEDACYNPKEKKYFQGDDWPVQLKSTTGTIQTLFYYQHSAILTYMSRVLVVLECWSGESMGSAILQTHSQSQFLMLHFNNRKKLQSL